MSFVTHPVVCSIVTYISDNASWIALRSASVSIDRALVLLSRCSLTAWYEMVYQKNISASARITSDSCDNLNSFDLPSSVISRQNLPAAVNVSAYAKKACLDGASASATSDQFFSTIAGNLCGVKLLHNAVSLLTVVISSRWSALARGNSTDGDHCCSFPLYLEKLM